MMILTCNGFVLLLFLLGNQGILAQIDTSQCGKTSCCFLLPNGCSGSSCDIAITFQYNKTNNVLDSVIGTKNQWVAFGLNSNKGQMDGSKGEVCFKDSGTGRLKGFSNNGYAPEFGVATNELSQKTNEIKNNFLVCRYSRPIKPASGSYMVDLNNKWHIVAAFGTGVAASNPSKHGQSDTATASSPDKLDFKVPCSITAERKSPNNVIAHGCLMIIAWVCCAATGMFIARYMKPVSGEKQCFGQKVWFQIHRLLMGTTLILTLIGFIIIFVHKEGWSEGAGAHPILGCIVTFLAILQPIMAAFRPHPGEDNRWIFNWAHRFVGSAALALAAATIILGLDLFQVEFVVIIIWAVACVVIIISMEVGLIFFGKSSSSAEYNPSSGTGSVELSVDQTAINFRKVMFAIAFILFFALGFAGVGLVAKKAA